MAIKIQRLKTNKVYLTKNPAKMVDSEIRKVLRIKMSCGGGMGGSSWYETVNPNVELIPNSLVEIETIEGVTKIINTNFVVSAVEEQLIKVTEIHQNTNFKETMGMELDYYYLAPLNVDVVIYNNYKYTDSWLC